MQLTGPAERLARSAELPHQPLNMTDAALDSFRRQPTFIRVDVQVLRDSESVAQILVLLFHYEMAEYSAQEEVPVVIEAASLGEVFDFRGGYPRFAAPQTFRKAPRRKRQQGVQQTLDA